MIHRHGGEDVTVDHPTTTLEELFLRIVQESELHPGRRKVAHDTGPPDRDARGRAGGNTVEDLIGSHVESWSQSPRTPVAERRPDASVATHDAVGVAIRHDDGPIAASFTSDARTPRN